MLKILVLALIIEHQQFDPGAEGHSRIYAEDYG
jgi:hypothetical protein